MYFYFRFQMRKYSFDSITGIDDWILEIWMIPLYDLNEIKTDEELTCIPHESIVSKMKSWVNIFLFQGFHIQFLFSEIIIIILSESLKLPEKSSYIRVYHSMSYLFEDLV